MQYDFRLLKRNKIFVYILYFQEAEKPLLSPNTLTHD